MTRPTLTVPLLESIEIAREKVYSGVALRRPTKVFQDLIGQGGANLRLLRAAGASVLEGGLPITAEGKIIGGTSEQDTQIAQAGIAAMQ